MTISPSETSITGHWLAAGSQVQPDEAERRIDWLLNNHLLRLSSDAAGWDTLLQDSNDGRLWELTYPQSYRHGGGPRRLTVISPETARLKYGRIPDPWLWGELHDLFESDDGSLPEVRINYVLPGSVAAAYRTLQDRASSIRNDRPYVTLRRGGDQPLESILAPAELVESGEADPFHVVLGGITHSGVTLPDLGVFVFDDQLALDYRMGPTWNAATLEAFFELLRDLVGFDPGASLSLEDGVDTSVAERFHITWQRWRESSA